MVPLHGESQILTAKEETSRFIADAMNARCHPERMWLACDHKRTYDQLIPCPNELYSALAYDYAVSQGWCDFTRKEADIEPLKRVSSVVDVGKKTSHQEEGTTTTEEDKKKIIVPVKNIASKRARALRLVFFFTVYTDAPSVARILGRLYSPYHYYLLHIDPNGATPGFEAELKRLLLEKVLSQKFQSTKRTFSSSNDIDSYGNIGIAKDVHIIYGASTASILLSKAMSWSLQNDAFISQAIDQTLNIHFDDGSQKADAKMKWDYFVPLTVFDYPLVSL